MDLGSKRRSKQVYHCQSHASSIMSQPKNDRMKAIDYNKQNKINQDVHSDFH